MQLRFNQLLGNSFYTVSRQGMTVIVTFIISSILARTLGPNGFGLYNLALLLPLMVTKFTNIGVRQAIVFYVGRKDYPLSQIVGTTLVVLVITSLLSLLIGAGLIIWGKDFLFPNVSTSLLWIALLSIPFLLLIDGIQGFFIGLQDFKIYNLITILPDIAFLIILLFIIWTLQLNVTIAILIYGISRLFILPYLKNVKKESNWNNWETDWDYLRNGITYSIKSHLGNIIAFLNYRLDQFLVNIYLGATQLGFYAAAVTLSEGIQLLSGGISTVLLPNVAELKDDQKTQMEITTLISRQMIFFSLLLSIILFFLSDWIVNLIYSEKLINASLAFRWLLPGIFMISFSRILATDLSGRGFPEINFYGGAAGIIINILVNILLIPRIGILGASIASSISYTVNSLIKIFLYIKISEARLKDILIFRLSDLKYYKILLSNIYSKYIGFLAER